jgi:hypothetical protein
MARHLVLILVAVVVIAHTVSAQSRFGGSSSMPRAGGSRSHSQVAPPPPLPTETTRRSGQPQAPPTTTASGVSQLPPLHGVAQLPPPVVNAQPRDLFRAGRRTYTPRLNRGYGSLSDRFGYVTGGYAGGDYSAGPADDRRADTSEPLDVGYLRLNVQPYSAQVFIDGFYVSTVDAFTGGGPARALPAGPHRVEIRADGYETATFDVRIDPNETITYRRELGKAEEPKQARNVAPAIPKTFYVIPKCYAGDKKPSANQLPKGCRASDLRTIPPVISSARKAG